MFQEHTKPVCDVKFRLPCVACTTVLTVALAVIASLQKFPNGQMPQYLERFGPGESWEQAVEGVPVTQHGGVAFASIAMEAKATNAKPPAATLANRRLNDSLLPIISSLFNERLPRSTATPMLL